MPCPTHDRPDSNTGQVWIQCYYSRVRRDWRWLSNVRLPPIAVIKRYRKLQA